MTPAPCLVIAGRSMWQQVLGAETRIQLFPVSCFLLPLFSSTKIAGTTSSNSGPEAALDQIGFTFHIHFEDIVCNFNLTSCITSRIKLYAHRISKLSKLIIPV
jgi:hypothetical protein